VPVNADDLPPEVRAKLGLGPGSGRKRPRLSRKNVEGGETPYECVACGEQFPSFDGVAGWEAHSKRSGHRRGQAVLGDRGLAPIDAKTEVPARPQLEQLGERDSAPPVDSPPGAPAVLDGEVGA